MYETRLAYLLVLLVIEIIGIVRFGLIAVVLISVRYNNLERWFGADVVSRMKARGQPFGFFGLLALLAVCVLILYYFAFNVKVQMHEPAVYYISEKSTTIFYVIPLFLASGTLFTANFLIFGLAELALNIFGTWPIGKFWRN